MLPFSSASKAVELTAMAVLHKATISSDKVLVNSGAETSSTSSWSSALGSASPVPTCTFARLLNLQDVPRVPATTVMTFCVSVPVLSEHTQVALPMVSHDRMTRTRLLSFSMRFVAKARASVTASGRPSGTATTTMVTATIRMSKKR